MLSVMLESEPRNLKYCSDRIEYATVRPIRMWKDSDELNPRPQCRKGVQYYVPWSRVFQFAEFCLFCHYSAVFGLLKWRQNRPDKVYKHSSKEHVHDVVKAFIDFDTVVHCDKHPYRCGEERLSNDAGHNACNGRSDGRMTRNDEIVASTVNLWDEPYLEPGQPVIGRFWEMAEVAHFVLARHDRDQKAYRPNRTCGCQCQYSPHGHGP